MSRFLFRKDLRLRKRAEFLAVQRAGRRVRSANFLLSYMSRQEEGNALPLTTRLGITITKKIDKRATRRNRLKRRIREFFRLHQHDIRGDVDLVVVALLGAAELPYSEISEQLAELFFRARLGQLRPRN